MNGDTNISLTIKDNVNNTYLNVPVLPATIAYKEGERKAITVGILNLGDVDFLSGVALDTISWTSFFPRRYDPSYCTLTSIQDPLVYKDQFKRWKNAGTSLQIICPAAGISTNMYIASFDWELKGAESDIYYSVEFKEIKQVRPIQIPVSAIQIVRPAAIRPAVPTPPQPRTYTVKPGDCLYRIAKNLGISDWNTIYNLNRDKIKNPNLIYPGQVFRLP